MPTLEGSPRASYPEENAARLAPWRQTLLWALLASFLTWLGRQTMLPGSGYSVLWPAAGANALWLWSHRGRPRLLAADLLLLMAGACAMNYVTHAPFTVAAAFAVINALLALSFSEAFQRWLPSDLQLLTIEQYTRLIIICFTAPVPSSALTLFLFHDVLGMSWSEAYISALSFAARCASGALIVITVAVEIRRGDTLADLRRDATSRLFVPSLLVLFGLESLMGGELAFPALLLILALHVMVAARFTTPLATILVAATGVALVLHIRLGGDIFGDHSPVIRAAYLQFYMAVLSGVVTLQAAYSSGRTRLLNDLRIAAEQSDLQLEVTAESERLYRMAFDRAPVGSLVVGVTSHAFGEILHANAEASTILGTRRGRLVGSNLLDWVDEADRPRVLDRIRGEVNSSPCEDELDIRAHDVDGQQRVLRLVTSLIKSVFDDTPCVMVLIEDVTTVRQAQEKLEFQALHDILTQLPNRTLFTDRLDHALAASSRHQVPVGLLYVDLDGFKRVNDTYGHETGDELLREVAERLRAVTRPEDTAARLGGDEFALICPQINDDGLRLVADRLIEVLAQPYVMSVGTVTDVGASVGAALAGAHAPIEEVIRKADAAMYEAKRSGRGRVRFAGQLASRDSVASR